MAGATTEATIRRWCLVKIWPSGQETARSKLCATRQPGFAFARKLEKFADLDTLANSSFLGFENIKEGHPNAAKWRESNFKNQNPIVLELGCGRGEYTIGLSKNDDTKNYIGLDIKGARLWRGAKTSNEENLLHVIVFFFLGVTSRKDCNNRDG